MLPPYLQNIQNDPRRFGNNELFRMFIIHTGITATAGIGTNLYLCKSCNGYCCKNMLKPDENGVRIAGVR